MTPDALTPRQRRLSLAVVIAGVFGVGVAFGAMIPLIALRLDRDGVDTALIGLNSAMFPIAVLAIGPFLPRLVGRLGTLRSMYAGLALGGATILLFPLFPTLRARVAPRPAAGAPPRGPWGGGGAVGGAVALRPRRGAAHAGAARGHDSRPGRRRADGDAGRAGRRLRRYGAVHPAADLWLLRRFRPGPRPGACH